MIITTLIADGCSLGPGRCALILQPSSDEVSEPEFDSFFVSWSETKGAEITELGFIASRLVQFNNGLFVLGRLGHVAQFRDGTMVNESIAGPEDLGFLTDLREIGGHLYAAGMWRQVYVRKGTNNWIRCDSGILDESDQVKRVTGFRSIDGLNENDIYAVGLEGEIWNYRGGVWSQIPSPTNVVLEQVKVVGANKVYAVGQAGMILRGCGESWEVIEQAETNDDFWGLEWFNNALYVASASHLFKLNTQDKLDPLVPPGLGASYLCRLRAGYGALWSFGPDEVFWTEDGKTWREARFQQPG